MSKKSKEPEPDLIFKNRRYYDIDSQEGKKLTKFWDLYK